MHSSSIGEIPQDLKFGGERTKTFIGKRTRIREYVTINRGTKELGETRVGSDCLLMASTHVAHDCIVGDNVIMSNLSTLGGHVEVGDWAILGGGVLVHQFTKIGSHVLIGGGFRAVQDVPPFILAADYPLKYNGVNLVGLKRRSFKKDEIKTLRNVYRLLFAPEGTFNERLLEVSETYNKNVLVKEILSFLKENLNRPLVHPKMGKH